MLKCKNCKLLFHPETEEEKEKEICEQCLLSKLTEDDVELMDVDEKNRYKFRIKD